MKKKLFYCLLSVLACSALGLVHSERAHAASNTFISTSTSAATKVTVEHTDQVSVPSIRLKWFRSESATGTASITLSGFCSGQADAFVEFEAYDAGLWDARPTSASGNYNQLPWVTKSCVGNDLVVSNIDGSWFQTQADLYPGYKVIIAHVTLRNSGAFAGNINQFKATVGANEYITPAEIGESASRSAQEPVNTDAFAILGNKTNSYGYDVTFSFKVSCNVANNSDTYYLHWRDADYDKSYGSGTYWELYDNGNLAYSPNLNNAPKAGTAAMGGTDQHATTPVTLVKGHNYSWVWKNVNQVNTLHIWMPFSEIQSNVSCPTNTTISCNITSVVTTSGSAEIHPNDQIVFYVTIANALPGSVLGVNGSNYAGSGDYGNYLLQNGGDYIRTPINLTGVTGVSLYRHGDSGPYNQGMFVPGSTGDYTFNWGIVRPFAGGGWDARCDYTVHVTNPLVDGVTCVAAAFTNDPDKVYPNSEYTMSVTFKNSGTTTWSPGIYNFGANQTTENYLTKGVTENRGSWPTGITTLKPGQEGVFTFTAPLPAAGGVYSSNWRMVHEAVAWLNPECGLKFTVAQGRFGDALNWSTPRSGSVDTCAGVVKTGQDGWYVFGRPQGWGYCARPSSASSQDAIYVRPFSVGYKDGAINCNPNAVCALASTYECQIAAGGPWPDCGNGNLDRSIDVGLDFALAWRPVVKCEIKDSGVRVVGTTFTPKVLVYNSTRKIGPQNNIIVPTESISGSIKYTSLGQNSGKTYANQSPSDTATSYDLTPNVTVNATGNITQSGFVLYQTTLFTVLTQVDCVGDINTNLPPPTYQGGYEPYIKVYGSDIRAGAVFKSGTTCAPVTSGSVYGFASGSGTSYKGSASQFSITSLMNVNQFFSGNNRTTNGAPPNGLTFANVSGTGDATYGGAYGGSGTCMTDFYTETQDVNIQKGAFIGNFATGKAQYTLAADSTLGATVVPLASQAAIYVDGNLYINGDIAYATGVANDAQLPNLVIIARGNIYIAASVKRLDGVYIAQPKAGSEKTQGRFYSCAKGLNNLYTASELPANCSTQLSINGALIAEQVKFLRTNNNFVTDSVVGEIPNFSDGSGTGNGGNSRAAEIINFTPEMYIAPSPLKDPNEVGTTTPTTYDAIYGLPPIY